MRDADQLRAVLRAGAPAVGLWLSIPSPLTAEVAAAAGADYVVIDEQHGAVDANGLLGMLQAVRSGGGAPLVRAGRNDPWVLGRALDLGAFGVIVPMVEDAEQAARAVAACRYAPAGVRSWGVVRGAPDPAPLCLVMIETRRGLEQAEEIVRTPGIDGVYVGPSDLALSLGLQPTPRLEHAAVLEAIEHVRAACERQGVIAGLHCLSGEDAARFAGQGFAMVTAGGDLRHLREGLAAALAAARAGSRRPPTRPV